MNAVVEPKVDIVEDVTPDVTPSTGYSETWREDYAGEDAGKLAKLAKYASPTSAFDAMISAQNKISSGEYKQAVPFPSDGSDDDKASWRTNNGVPESSDKYDLTFDNGLVVGEDDKEMIDGFLKFSHDKNATPDSVKNAVEWYYDNKEREAEQRSEADALVRTSSEDELRAEWGDEYRSNINRIGGLLDTAPEGVKDSIMSARFPDGTPLASDPNTLRFLADMATQINPATTVVPGAGDNIAGAISDELNNLKTLMGNKSSEYWKGPKADTNQARYRELLGAQIKIPK